MPTWNADQYLKFEPSPYPQVIWTLEGGTRRQVG